jgi:hypothetical protein
MTGREASMLKASRDTPVTRDTGVPVTPVTDRGPYTSPARPISSGIPSAFSIFEALMRLA